MTPTVICAGFRRCGVYPFNPQTIDCSIRTENPEASLTRPNDEQTETEDGLMENGGESTITEFSIDQEQRFQTRFEEGYDLMDPEYLHWLEINHPDSVPADRHMLVLAPESSGGISEDSRTLTDVFSFVQPSSPLTMTVSECATSSNSLSTAPYVSTTASADTTPTLETTPHASTTESAKTLPTPEFTPHASTAESPKTPPTLESTPHASTTESAKTASTPESTPHTSSTESAKTSPTLDSVVHNKAPVMTSPHTSGVGLAKTSPTLDSSVLTKTPVTTPSSTPSPAGTSSGESDPELWYISKYLVQVISNATPKSSTSAAKRVSGARVLTSAKCAAILEEREEKKKKEIEEKNKRKVEREQKKKEKEEAAKKKAEERANKKPKRQLRSGRIELRREQCQRQIPVPRQKSERLPQSRQQQVFQLLLIHVAQQALLILLLAQGILHVYISSSSSSTFWYK